MTIPAKFSPATVILPVLPLVLTNWKLPVERLPNGRPSSISTSASNVDTPTALRRDFTSLKLKSLTLVIILPFGLPLIKIVSSFKNLPAESIKVNSVRLLPPVTTNPVAPLLAP